MARVLLIDDDGDLRTVTAEILTGAGHDIRVAADGNEGLEALRRDAPDIVVCDINMPGLDGFGVLRAIRADPQLAPVPFVFLTSEADVRAGLVSGADDYLLKPVSGSDLLRAIEARLARRETARKETARRVSEVRQAVAALLPHELRTPLTTILGSARLLQEFHRDFGPEQVEEMATGILKAAQRLHRMMENYILFADLEARRLTGRSGPDEGLRESSGAADVTAAAMEAASQRKRSGDLDLDVQAAAVPLGAAYLRKAVSELCDNAFKFSAPGTAVRVSLRPDGKGAVLEVADGGKGMTPEEVRDVGAFQQFDRGRAEQQGSGIGLTLVRGIAEASGARFEIVSRPGEGTAVRVRWPG